MVFGLAGKKKAAGGSGTINVALIGCGPGGMCFLHALNKAKQADPNGPASKVNVNCFERAASSGGIWRDVPKDDPNRTKPDSAPLM